MKGKKRKNPSTGKLFKKGDLRDDGAIFEKYTNIVKKSNGFYSEQWNASGRKEGKFSINPLTNKIFQHGDKDTHGNMFRGWDLNRVKVNGYYTEMWIKKSTLQKRLNAQSKGSKRINPLTNKYFVMGDTRNEDNKLFFCYREKVRDDGYKVEEWWSPRTYKDKRIEKNFRAHKNKCKKNGVKFNITLEYLKEIFPKDSKCPVLGIKMKFGGQYARNSPSLDKIIPDKGYVVGNVAWISFKANAIKNNANFDEILRVGNWLKKYTSEN